METQARSSCEWRLVEVADVEIQDCLWRGRRGSVQHGLEAQDGRAGDGQEGRRVFKKPSPSRAIPRDAKGLAGGSAAWRGERKSREARGACAAWPGCVRPARRASGPWRQICRQCRCKKTLESISGKGSQSVRSGGAAALYGGPCTRSGRPTVSATFAEIIHSFTLSSPRPRRRSSVVFLLPFLLLVLDSTMHSHDMKAGDSG